MSVRTQLLKFHSKLFLALVVASMVGCSGCINEKNKQETTYISQDQLIEENRKALQLEKEDIDNYIKEKGWEVEETGTGLRYWIYNEGEGPKAKQGDLATIEYEVKLMEDEKVVYSSEKSGPKTFEVGKDDVESGLHEGVLKMNVGDEAIFVLPSHLAYGLSGDRSKIPFESPLIYDVKLVKLD